MLVDPLYAWFQIHKFSWEPNLVESIKEKTTARWILILSGPTPYKPFLFQGQLYLIKALSVINYRIHNPGHWNGLVKRWQHCKHDASRIMSTHICPTWFWLCCLGTLPPMHRSRMLDSLLTQPGVQPTSKHMCEHYDPPARTGVKCTRSTSDVQSLASVTTNYICDPSHPNTTSGKVVGKRFITLWINLGHWI